MDVELISPLSGRPGRLLRRAEPGGWRVAALAAIVAATLAFGWLIVEAPAIESFALAVALAVAWSMWLDRRSEQNDDA